MDIDVYNSHPLFSMDYIKYDSEYDMPNIHHHNSYELYFLEEGYHNILINDSVHDVTKYDVALCKPNIFHKSLKKINCARTCIYFTDRFLRLHFTEHSIKSLLSCFEKEVISLNKEIFPQIKKLMFLLQKEDISTSDNRIFIYLANILNILNDNKESLRKEHIPSTYTNFSPILSYINENYNKISTLDEIANKFYISKFYLCHLFKENIGLTLVQYINKIKIQNACDMLINTTLSISEIGGVCGFNSSMYFCKTFKQALSITPSEFRKKAL
ncbi:AraC family transcriptional regulator [Clostridium sp. SHJSY1]|uniref:AraC family transcriptional regulator n=1 Tax=Clostridium sp. SHJSY1 TaxID=2942483 RepID=UPI002875B4DF|nr:AraC family transcriptional regulator [Clostridium sp. SHJSY1]MDS0526327.1 AraC family transcriptional regulator [Clostridium sp. SHJSY1]